MADWEKSDTGEPLIDLLREARDELLWWIDEHGCCAGHEGDLIDRIDAVVDVTPSAAAPRS